MQPPFRHGQQQIHLQHHQHHHRSHVYYTQSQQRRFNPAIFNSTVAKSSVLLQSVITLGEKVEEGRVIEAVAPAWAEIIRLLEEDPDILFKIEPRKMEEMIAAAYQQAGFDEVILTPRSADFGRDVIAVKRDYCTIRVIDSVKRYAPGHLVKADDVRALLGVLAGDPKATKGVITTTSDFAPMIPSDPFICQFIPYRLELINGENLVRRLSELANKE
jgi:restriction system protein